MPVLSFSLLGSASSVFCLPPFSIQAPVQESSVDQLMRSAEASLARGDLPGAARSLEQAVAKEERNKAARVALVNVLIRLMRWSEAENHAQILKKQFPEETEPVHLLALIAFGHGRLQLASDLARE